MGLAVLLAQTGAASDDLLELCHGTDHLIQDNQLGHFAVRAGGEQLGGGRDDRPLR